MTVQQLEKGLFEQYNDQDDDSDSDSEDQEEPKETKYQKNTANIE